MESKADPPAPAANTANPTQQQQYSIAQQPTNNPYQYQQHQPTNNQNQYQQQQPMNAGQGQYNQGQPGMQQQYYQNQTPMGTMMMGPPGVGGYGYPQPYFQQPPLILGPPAPIDGVPLGLEPLGPLDHIFVKQQIELLEMISGFETANRYDVLAGNGQRIYFAQETSDCCALCCGGSARPFQIKIVDFFGRTVLQLDRPCDCCLYISQMPFCCCWFGKIGGSMVVNLPDGSKLGDVIHVFNCCEPKYEIRDAAGGILMFIGGPSCGDCCGAALCGTAEFPITSSTGEEIGTIRKHFSGLYQEMMTDADNFGVNFLPNLSIEWKALIFAAVFLIDFMYFESSSSQNQHHHHY